MLVSMTSTVCAVQTLPHSDSVAAAKQLQLDNKILNERAQAAAARKAAAALASCEPHVRDSRLGGIAVRCHLLRIRICSVCLRGAFILTAGGGCQELPAFRLARAELCRAAKALLDGGASQELASAAAPDGGRQLVAAATDGQRSLVKVRAALGEPAMYPQPRLCAGVPIITGHG